MAMPRTTILHRYLNAHQLPGWSTTGKGARFSTSRGTGTVTEARDGASYTCSWQSGDQTGSGTFRTAPGATGYVMQQVAAARPASS